MQDHLIDESYIINLLDTDLHVKLAFAEFMPIYAESKYHNDFQTQHSCIKSITERILLRMPKDLMIDPRFRIYFKDISKKAMDKQLKTTPHFIREELKRLKGRLNTFNKLIDLEVIKNGSQFDETTQNMIINYKIQCMQMIDDYFTIFENIMKDISLDDSFDKNSIVDKILKQTSLPRIAKLNISDKEQINLSCTNQEVLNLSADNNDKCETDLSFTSTEDIEKDHSCDLSDPSDNDPDYPFHKKVPNPHKKIDFSFDITKTMESGTFALHILSIGLTPNQAITFLNHLGIKCYSRSTVFRAQNAIAPIIIKASHDSMDYQYIIMSSDVGVMFDGAWSHCRNAYQHSSVLIESCNKKIITAKVLSKDYRGHVGNYNNEKAGNLMEVHTLKLMKNVIFSKILGLSHSLQMEILN